MALAKVRQANQQGFTLIELLIVVVILGVLAAVIVPQLSGSTTDAQDSARESNLAALRSAIAMYYQEHGEYPGVNTAVGTGCPTGSTVGSGTGGSGAQAATAFAEQLTMYTNSAGGACSISNATFEFGPYLKADQIGAGGIPTSNGSNTVTVSTTGNLSMSAGTGGGWTYDNVTGQIIANNP